MNGLLNKLVKDMEDNKSFSGKIPVREGGKTVYYTIEEYIEKYVKNGTIR